VFIRGQVAGTAALVLLAALPSWGRAQDTTIVRDSTVRRDTTHVDSTQAMRDSVARLDSLRAINNPHSDSALTRATEYAPTRTAGNVKPPRVTSDVRIPIRKESGGEVDLRADEADSIARADSMAMAKARADSIAREERMRRDSIVTAERARQDSIAMVMRLRQDSIDAVARARADSIARVDSIAQAEAARKQRVRDRYLFDGSGWYVSLAGGGAIPAGDFDKLGYDNGYTMSIPIGWHSPTNFLGVRLDLGYSQFNGRQVIGTGTGSEPLSFSNTDPKIWSAVLNVTARVPLNGAHSVNLYGLGGGGIYHFTDFGASSGLAAFLGDEVLPVESATEGSRNEFGAQVGAGIDFGIGPASFYLESRMVNVYSRRDENSDFANIFGSSFGKDIRWVPLILGVTFR